jgi:hypothetical protein
MPITFCISSILATVHRQRSRWDQTVPHGKTYLKDLYDDHEIIILKVDTVFSAHCIGD